MGFTSISGLVETGKTKFRNGNRYIHQKFIYAWSEEESR